jgi:hypothetical protein
MSKHNNVLLGIIAVLLSVVMYATIYSILSEIAAGWMPPIVLHIGSFSVTCLLWALGAWKVCQLVLQVFLKIFDNRSDST